MHSGLGALITEFGILNLPPLSPPPPAQHFHFLFIAFHFPLFPFVFLLLPFHVFFMISSFLLHFCFMSLHFPFVAPRVPSRHFPSIVLHFLLSSFPAIVLSCPCSSLSFPSIFLSFFDHVPFTFPASPLHALSFAFNSPSCSCHLPCVSLSIPFFSSFFLSLPIPSFIWLDLPFRSVNFSLYPLPFPSCPLHFPFISPSVPINFPSLLFVEPRSFFFNPAYTSCSTSSLRTFVPTDVVS